jgi:hypothetical protein
MATEQMAKEGKFEFYRSEDTGGIFASAYEVGPNQIHCF